MQGREKKPKGAERADPGAPSATDRLSQSLPRRSGAATAFSTLGLRAPALHQIDPGFPSPQINKSTSLRPSPALPLNSASKHISYGQGKLFPPFFHHQIRQETGSAVAASRSALRRGEHRVFLPGSRVPGGCPTRVLRATPNLPDRPVRTTEPQRLSARRSETATVLRLARAPEPPFSALPGFWVQAQPLLLRAGEERGAPGCSRLGPRLRSRSERAPPAGSCGRASHAASGQQPWHLPGRPHWGSAGPPPRPAGPSAPQPSLISP